MISVNKKSGDKAEESVNVSSMLFLLLISGFVLIFVGVVVILIDAMLQSNGSASSGVVIFIGPFPIVIGAGPDVSVILLFSVILAMLGVVVFWVMNRKMRSLDD